MFIDLIVLEYTEIDFENLKKKTYLFYLFLNRIKLNQIRFFAIKCYNIIKILIFFFILRVPNIIDLIYPILLLIVLVFLKCFSKPSFMYKNFALWENVHHLFYGQFSVLFKIPILCKVFHFFLQNQFFFIGQ